MSSVGVVFQKHEEAKVEIARLNGEVTQLKSDMKQLHQEHLDSVAKCDHYCQENNSLKQDATRHSNGLQTLKKTLDSVRQEKVALEQQKRSVDKQCGEIRKELEALKKQNQQTEKDLKESKTSNQQLSTENQNMASTASQSEKEIARLNTQLGNIQRQLSQTRTAKEAAEKERTAALGEGEKTKKVLKECQAKLEAEKTQCQLANDTVKAKNTELANVRAELQAKGRELLAVTKVKDDLQGKVTSANAAINSRDDDLTKAREKEQELMADLRKCRAELEATQSARDKLQRSKDTLEEEKAALDIQVRQLSFKLEVRAEDISKKEKKEFSLMKELEEAQKAIEEGDALEPVLRRNIEELEEDKKDLMDKFEKNEVRASQLAQASERVGSLIPASQQG